MKNLQALIALGLCTLSALARAEDIRPGLWKISLESGVAATPDWKPQPFEITQCLNESDAKNPEQLLLGMGSPGATGCDIRNRKSYGNSLKFDVICTGTLGIRGQGEVTYTATTVDGFLNVNLGETEKIDLHNKIHATYQGDCPAAGGGGLPMPLN